MPPFAFRRSSFGFTLVEIMIVLAIIMGVLVAGAPKLFSSGSSMRTSVRKIAVMTREVRNNARLYNTTNRLVINMDPEKGHSYWVESASGVTPLLSEDQEKEIEKLTELQKESSQDKNKFQQDTRFTKGAVSLPKGLFFENVEFGAREKAIDQGVAYIHFFPSGLSEDVAIHMTDRKTLNWTILINPLTGRAEVLERKVSLKELRQQ